MSENPLSDKGGYEADAVSMLNGMARSRPWQLLLTGDGLVDLDAKTIGGLTRILDLFPAVTHLLVQTTAGHAYATRDFSSGYTKEVDQILAGIFQGNAAVTGVTFPAAPGTPAHTATPDGPHWMAACTRGEITANEATARLDRLYRQTPA